MTRGAGLLCLSPLEDASLPPQGRAYQRNPWMPQARTKKTAQSVLVDSTF